MSLSKNDKSFIVATSAVTAGAVILMLGTGLTMAGGFALMAFGVITAIDSQKSQK